MIVGPGPPAAVQVASFRAPQALYGRPNQSLPAPPGAAGMIQTGVPAMVSPKAFAGPRSLPASPVLLRMGISFRVFFFFFFFFFCVKSFIKR